MAKILRKRRERLNARRNDHASIKSQGRDKVLDRFDTGGYRFPGSMTK